ncbi:GNAT family N-acetyltransferase [Streptomyces lydicus]|uniref:GNAT family N-acetyltransferase n=1 Tax=Streptomyces lydicus TaxID=47763 RepID=UPI0033D97258
MTTPADAPRPPSTTRIDMVPLQRPDHADYLALLALTNPGEQLPAATSDLLTMPPFAAPFTHGPALCLTARPRRSSNPKPAGALFASFPEWASAHALVQGDPQLSALLNRAALFVYGVAVTPSRRGHGIARALLTEAESRARTAGYRMSTLLHTPELTPFYQRMGYTSAHHVTIAMRHAGMGLTQPSPYMTAIKPLHPNVQIREIPGAPGPVVAGLLPGWDLPPHARFNDGRLLT